jgi:glycolate oxidase FAD binding subunit
MQEYDDTAQLHERVLSAIANKTPLQILGGNNKAFYGRPVIGEPLEVAKHCGILQYEPSELVITARSGTPLSIIETTLAGQGQMLAFEPPHFGTTATLGGTVATGLSGSRRPYAGAVRDVVLGIRLINGLGENVKFGGEVMKNVAGFDVPRLQVGALGTLGVLLDISLKVLPRPEVETTLSFTMTEAKALATMATYSKKNSLISGLCFENDTLYLRLSGAESAIAKVREKLGGEILTPVVAKAFWLSVREQKRPFFQGETPLWRLSMAAATAQPKLSGTWLIDWGGALRWLKTEESPETLFSAMSAVSGHACRFRSSLGCEFQPLTAALEKLNRNVKQAFDPQGIFNPGKFYPNL